MTFLSNGYGEDAIGALLAEALRELRPGWQLQAFPLVDTGRPYERLELPILGPRRAMPSGGLLLHDWRLLRRDLQAGFLGMTLRQLHELSRLRTDLLFVIGDFYALALSAFVRGAARFHLQPLVSVHHAQPQHARQWRRYFMEHISYPERALMRHLARRVYVRDAATARALNVQGLEHVRALGNPVLDALQGRVMPEHRGAPFRVALLPGTRGYAPRALERMLRALEHLPEATALVAWAGGELPAASGWRFEPAAADQQGLRGIYRHRGQQAYLYEGRFADVLHTAELALGTAGTANEQAAALGRPIVAFPVPPDYSRAFLENQQRLLGPALTLAPDEPTAIAAALLELRRNPERYRQAAAAGRARMGGPGGSRAILEDMLACVES